MNLKNLNLEEISIVECKNKLGGFWKTILSSFLLASLWNSEACWDTIVNGYIDGRAPRTLIFNKLKQLKSVNFGLFILITYFKNF